MSAKCRHFWLLDLAKREATYGAGLYAAATWVWYKATEIPRPVRSRKEDTDADEAKGVLGVQSATTIYKGGSVTVKQKFNSEVFAYMMANMMANVATSGITNYTHTIIEPANTVQSPWSFAFVFASDRSVTGTFKEYRGCVVNSIKLACEGKGPWTVEYEIRHDGSETDASAVTPPAVDSALDGTRFYNYSNTLLLGPVGNEDVTIYRRKTEITFTNDLQEVDIDSRGVYAGRFDLGQDAPAIDIKITLAGGEYGTFYNYWNNATAIIVDLTLSVSATKSVQFQFNSAECVQEGDSPSELLNNIEKVVNLPIRAKWLTADTSRFVCVVKNQVAAYSAAA